MRPPPSLLLEVLSGFTKLKVVHAHRGERLHPGTVYIASPELHLVVRANHTLDYTDGRKIRHSRSSANPLFTSASEVFRPRVIAVVLTGGDADATDGVQSVKQGGGVIAQERSTCVEPSMPRSAIETGSVDFIVPLDKIADTLIEMTQKNP